MTDTPSTPKRRRWLRITLIAFPLLLALVASQIWFYDYGTGEYKDSPDGRYTAELHRVYERTLFDGEITYVQASVSEKATGNTVWTLEYKPANTSNLQDYADRSQTFIQWNTTSDEVVFPLDQSGK